MISPYILVLNLTNNKPETSLSVIIYHIIGKC